MIVTKHFVYIHTSRTAGTFLNKLIRQHVPDARMLQYHGHLRDLPEEYSHLPVIGFVRNPWDWYVSMCFDYQRKGQFVFRVLTEGNALDFAATVSRFLKLGDNSDTSKRNLQRLVTVAPKSTVLRNPGQDDLAGLRSEHFEDYPDNTGYYSWLFKLMYESDRQHDIHIGRFENVRKEIVRLFEETGTPITDGITTYLKNTGAMNSSRRPRSFVPGYGPLLEQLVAEKEKYLIDRFGYDFSETK